MTQSFRLQIALLGFGYLWLGWVFFQELQKWLINTWRERMMNLDIESVNRLEHDTAISAEVVDRVTVYRLIAEKVAQNIADLEYDRQEFDKKLAEAQEKFRDTEKQRYERKKALEGLVAAKIKEIGVLPRQYMVRCAPRGVKFRNVKTSSTVF